MSFRHLPPKHGRRLRGVLAIVYAFVAYTGLSALVWTPTTMAATMGEPITWAWATLAVAGALAGLWGVARDSWRTERWAVPVMVGALAPCAVVAWALAVTSTPGWQTYASAVTVAVLLLAYRALELSARAQTDRQVHEHVKEA